MLRCVRHHHERIDRGGYPNGLAGNAIPLGARIITVCYSVDAMRTTRPYRDPLSDVDVRDELIRCRGTQFDPDVVDAFLEIGVLDAEDAPVAPAADRRPVPARARPMLGFLSPSAGRPRRRAPELGAAIRQRSAAG